ncbi:hypothetical protein TraAM80_05832 [Trypanosoma rangeli]|uniref:Uncharacterized protein n=1 Tax=Trypanosoma rangeli TaxID=5698 RepID=A0A422NCW6_TRYRA|nr:uncharacterized protein TraAM80_05832 [Trypanosoma rangeli]RNF03315.1 hypothetical protein TraAM80_05832 [Trypanosoma rangeli]|eukprot:RNF03315.1 hypothetical protein TraAM80_05832 [Trypanosoma rangeli]
MTCFFLIFFLHYSVFFSVSFILTSFVRKCFDKYLFWEGDLFFYRLFTSGSDGKSQFTSSIGGSCLGKQDKELKAGEYKYSGPIPGATGKDNIPGIYSSNHELSYFEERYPRNEKQLPSKQVLGANESRDRSLILVYLNMIPH